MEFVTSEWGISSRIPSLPCECLLIWLMSCLVNLTTHQVHKAPMLFFSIILLINLFLYLLLTLSYCQKWVFQFSGSLSWKDHWSAPVEKLESLKHFTAKNHQAPGAAVANWAEGKWFSFQDSFSCSESTTEFLVWKDQPLQVHGHPSPCRACRACAAVGSVCCCGAEEGVQVHHDLAR